MKLTDIPYFVRKYKTDMLVFSLCVIIAFGLYLFLGKKMYRSQAEILVKDTQPAFSAQASASEGPGPMPKMRSETVMNELRVLTSNDALMATARAIAGPQLSHTELLDVRRYIGDKLSARVLGGTDIIALSFEFPDPAGAQNVLRTLLDQYKTHYGRSYFDESEQGSLRKRMEAALKSYNEAQEKLLTFERENNVFDDRQIGVLNETREQLQINLNSLTNEYAYTQRKRDYIQNLMRNVPQEMLYGSSEVPNDTYRRLQERLAKTTADHARQLSRDNPDPKVLNKLDTEIKQLQALMKKEPRFVMDADEKETRLNEARDTLNRQLLELYPEVEAQKARMDNIRAQVAEIDDALAQSAASRADHILLAQDVEMKRIIYEQCQADYTTSTGGVVAQQFPLGTVIASPSFSPAPVSPDLTRTLAWAAAVLILGNCALFMLSLTYDTTVSRPWQAADRFKLPVMGMLDGRATANHPQLPYFEAHRDELRNIYIKLHSQVPVPKSILFTSVENRSDDPSPAEAFAAYALKYHGRKPVVVRYSPLAATGENGGPSMEPSEARLPGLPVYSRNPANLPKERLLWEKLKANCDMLIIEYTPLREGEFLFALAESIDETVIGVELDHSNRAHVQHTIALMREYGFKTGGLLLHRNYGETA